jgi:hypothetical protein
MPTPAILGVISGETAEIVEDDPDEPLPFGRQGRRIRAPRLRE